MRIILNFAQFITVYPILITKKINLLISHYLTASINYQYGSCRKKNQYKIINLTIKIHNKSYVKFIKVILSL